MRTKRRNKPKVVVVNPPLARCITGYFCAACKPHYHLALAMGLHPRLGAESVVAVLTADLLQLITSMTEYKRRLPEWMCCSWDLKNRKAKLENK